MRWNRTESGTVRDRRDVFLWLPKRIKDQTRWLERASWQEYYDSMIGWIPERWLNP